MLDNRAIVRVPVPDVASAGLGPSRPAKGHSESGHGIPYRDYMMVPVKVLMFFRLTRETLTVAQTTITSAHVTRRCRSTLNLFHAKAKRT